MFDDRGKTFYKDIFLPKVDSFEGCNENFGTLKDTVVFMIAEMKADREHTHKNMTTIVEEVNDNISKLTSDMNSILSSQTMMIVICIISISLALITIKGLFDFGMTLMNLFGYG